MPWQTRPKTVCFPSSHGVGASVTKNCDPLVLGPALAWGVGGVVQRTIVRSRSMCRVAGARQCDDLMAYHAEDARARVLQVPRNLVLELAPAR